MSMQDQPGAELAAFAAALHFDRIPAPVLCRTEDLFLDWTGSALAGKSARAVQAIEAYARSMGPADGAAEVLITRRLASPHFAAMVNAAASHVVEQDDVHNGSVFHPGAVVFPPALAVAQSMGEFLGRSHYRIFHTTGTFGTLAAAAATGRLLPLDAAQMLHAFGTAGTQAAGLWEFLRDAADPKQLRCARAASSWLASAYLARDGFTGARQILEGAQALAAGMSSDADPSRLTGGLGSRWATVETSFKHHASVPSHPSQCRCAAAADARAPDQAARPGRRRRPGAPGRNRRARQGGGSHDRPPGQVFDGHGAGAGGRTRLCRPGRIRSPLPRPGRGRAAGQGVAGVGRRGRQRLSAALDRQGDRPYPRRPHAAARVDEPKGDSGNTLSRPALEDKARRLATYGGAATTAEMDALIARTWALADAPRMGRGLPQ